GRRGRPPLPRVRRRPPRRRARADARAVAQRHQSAPDEARQTRAGDTMSDTKDHTLTYTPKCVESNHADELSHRRSVARRSAEDRGTPHQEGDGDRGAGGVHPAPEAVPDREPLRSGRFRSVLRLQEAAPESMKVLVDTS